MLQARWVWVEHQTWTKITAYVHTGSSVSLQHRPSRKVVKADKGIPSEVERLLFFSTSYATENKVRFQMAMSQLHVYEKQVNCSSSNAIENRCNLCVSLFAAVNGWNWGCEWFNPPHVDHSMRRELWKGLPFFPDHRLSYFIWSVSLCLCVYWRKGKGGDWEGSCLLSLHVAPRPTCTGSVW